MRLTALRYKGGNAAPAAEGNNAPKRKTNNKRSGGNKKSNNSNQKQQGSIQPDPRWADELAKLKEMLASANN